MKSDKSAVYLVVEGVLNRMLDLDAHCAPNVAAEITAEIAKLSPCFASALPGELYAYRQASPCQTCSHTGIDHAPVDSPLGNFKKGQCIRHGCPCREFLYTVPVIKAVTDA